MPTPPAVLEGAARGCPGCACEQSLPRRWDESFTIRSPWHAQCTMRNEPLAKHTRLFCASPAVATDLIGKQLAYQLKPDRKRQARNGGSEGPDPNEGPIVPQVEPSPGPGSDPVWLDRSKCLEFAVGSIGAVLGPDFAEIDRFPDASAVARSAAHACRPDPLDRGRATVAAKVGESSPNT